MADYFYGACYKFRRFGAINSTERTHLRDLILDRRMMFSSPTAFNDPYDCRPVFVQGEDPAEDRARIERAWEEGRVRAGHTKPSKRDRERHISKVMREFSTPEGAAAQFSPVLDSNTGVFCMSKDWRLLTQWAYYADGGRGLCLEYTVSPSGGFDRVFEVEYCNVRPRVQIARLLDDGEYRTEVLFTSVTRKATDWSHEREVRALHTEPGLLIHPEGMLVSIMIGIATSPDDERWLVDTLKAGNIQVQLYRTQLCQESFELARQVVPN